MFGKKDKIRNLGKEALYKIGEALSYFTPLVPGDLQVKIGEKYPEIGEFGDYYYSPERTAGSYTHISSIFEGAIVGLPLFLIGGFTKWKFRYACFWRLFNRRCCMEI